DLRCRVQVNEAIPLSNEEIALDAASSEGSMSGPDSDAASSEGSMSGPDTEEEEAESEANYGYDVYHDDC
nr:hypothetical protein [Tanacetum cinerariifolium]